MNLENFIARKWNEGSMGGQAAHFHYGSPSTREAVVDRYIAMRSLDLTVQQKADLVQSLRSR